MWYKFDLKDIANLVKKSGVLLALIALVVFLSITSNVFFTTHNILNILRQVSVNLILSIGTAIVILTGGIDVSIGAIMAFSAVVAASLMNSLGILTASILGIFIGLGIGTMNGLAVGMLGLEPFVVTLSTMLSIRGLAYVYTKGYPVSDIPGNYAFLGSGYVGFMPLPILLSISIFILASIILKYTPFGRHIYAIGDNETAARLSGINVKMTKTLVYTINGGLAAFAGLILVSRLISAVPTVGMNAPFDAIAAVVMGGISLSGGKGSLWGMLIGVLLLGTISNGLNLLRIQSFWQEVVRGIVIFIAILIDRLRVSKRL
ncbi:MAG: ribose ABC transporter permease [Thermotogae bacterium]|nr:ribose ABC transporter permease [Thermotogota bacterium]